MARMVVGGRRPSAILAAALAVGFAGAAFGDDAAGGKLAIPIPVPNVSAATLTDDQVVASLDKGIEFLLAKQQPDGGWETDVFENSGMTYSGGNTALVLYTLLHVGQSLTDQHFTAKSKQLQKAIEITKKIGSTDLVYLKAMQMMALSEMHGTPEQRREVTQQGRSMLQGMNPKGGYLYHFTESPQITGGKAWDNSATQMTLLAAWGMAEDRVEVANAYWAAQDHYWRAHQNADGGWGYGPNQEGWKKSSPSMTAAGVASLFVLDEQLHPSIGLTAIPDKQLDHGLDWLDQNFDVGGMFSLGWPSGYFSLFSIERVALASGRKYIGGKDWYREGAASLMKRQEPDGRFQDHYYFHDGKGGIIPTCFALLFLARGRNPVAFSKLEYPGNRWDARQEDLANLTRWMGGQFERAINWQTVSFKNDPEEWLDSPVLLITGSVDPKFTDDDIAKLRKYVELGGMIFSSTDGGGLGFTKAMEGYAAKIVGGKYEMRNLPADHPLFTSWGKLTHSVHLRGMSNGIRELWVHSPMDLGAVWERRAYASTDDWTLPANVFFYTAGSTESLAPRLRSLKVAEATGSTSVKVTLGRLDYAGNWDPEPGAWPRFAKLMRRDAAGEVDVVAVKADDLDAAKIPVVHLIGTGDLDLPDAVTDKLKAYLDKGGTLLIDNGTGAKLFSDCVGRLTGKLGLGELAPIPGDDPLYAGAFPGGAKIERMSYRQAAQAKGAGNDRGDLLGAKKGHRWALIFAPENITDGLLGTHTQGIVGYEPASAVAMARNMVFYAAGNKK